MDPNAHPSATVTLHLYPVPSIIHWQRKIYGKQADAFQSLESLVFLQCGDT